MSARPIVVYGIPTCGTVKKARAALDDANAAHSFVDFRQTPPSAAQVATWVKTFGVAALKNTSGGSYRALGAEKDSWSDAAWTQAFQADPMLIKRPVVEVGGVPVVVGFRGDVSVITRAQKAQP
jgi:arsenate reductase